MSPTCVPRTAPRSAGETVSVMCLEMYVTPARLYCGNGIDSHLRPGERPGSKASRPATDTTSKGRFQRAGVTSLVTPWWSMKFRRDAIRRGPHVGIVAGVAHGEVFPDGHLEVATALADDDGTVDGRRPDDRPAEDLAQVVQHRVAAVLGGLGDSGEGPGPERDRVWSGDVGTAVSSNSVESARA